MKSKIKTAVIGVGNMGKNHVRIYSLISDLVSIADVDEEIGRTIAKTYHTKYYKNYQEMLDRERIEAVSVVVPTPYHRQVVEVCLKHRIPTMVEKPIAGKVTDAPYLIRLSEEYKANLMVGHVERFNPAVIKLRQLIKEGKLGNIISIVSQRVGISFPNIKNSNVLIDLGIHDVDVFNFLLNELPIRTKIVTHKMFKNNQADSASMILEYKNTCCLLQVNWITPIKMRKLFVTGTDGFTELDYIKQKIVMYDKIVEKKRDGNFFEFLSMY